MPVELLPVWVKAKCGDQLEYEYVNICTTVTHHNDLGANSKSKKNWEKLGTKKFRVGDFLSKKRRCLQVKSENLRGDFYYWTGRKCILNVSLKF